VVVVDTQVSTRWRATADRTNASLLVDEMIELLDA
jgi:hypothetical protein